MIALHPADFAGGAKSPDGSPWVIGEDEYTTNPRLLQTEGDHAMVRLWSYFRGGGMGAGWLPTQIGPQSALMLDAFDVMTAAYREFTAKPEERRR
jgi:hypothetical protein